MKQSTKRAILDGLILGAGIYEKIPDTETDMDKVFVVVIVSIIAVSLAYVLVGIGLS